MQYQPASCCDGVREETNVYQTVQCAFPGSATWVIIFVICTGPFNFQSGTIWKEKHKFLEFIYEMCQLSVPPQFNFHSSGGQVSSKAMFHPWTLLEGRRYWCAGVVINISYISHWDWTQPGPFTKMWNLFVLFISDWISLKLNSWFLNKWG